MCSSPACWLNTTIRMAYVVLWASMPAPPSHHGCDCVCVCGVQATVLAGAMQELQDLFEQKLMEMVPDHQWQDFDTHIQMLLERWAQRSNAVLFANEVRVVALARRMAG